LVSAWVYQQGFNAFFKPKKRYLPPADYFGVSLPLGHVLGRLGCFAQGCCYGRPTELPWGVMFTDPACSVKPELRGLPLHPVQLYEAAGELVISLWIMRWLLPRIRAGRFRYGTAFFGYIGLYAILRFVTESFRGDDRGSFLAAWLSPSQWWSIAALAIAACALWRNGIKETQPTARSLYF
jgi:phosphatidylglycerol:prolipoprotein diacylglycerol transferase